MLLTPKNDYYNYQKKQRLDRLRCFFFFFFQRLWCEALSNYYLGLQNCPEAYVGVLKVSISTPKTNLIIIKRQRSVKFY